MAFLGSILRSRRGDFNLFLIAALVALLVVPGASGAAIAPQSAEAVLLWLHSESVAVETLAAPAPTSALLSISHQKSDTATKNESEIQLSAATFHCGQHLAPIPQKTKSEFRIAPATPVLERHALAHLSGIRTNRRLI